MDPYSPGYNYFSQRYSPYPLGITISVRDIHLTSWVQIFQSEIFTLPLGYNYFSQRYSPYPLGTNISVRDIHLTPWVQLFQPEIFTFRTYSPSPLFFFDAGDLDMEDLFPWLGCPAKYSLFSEDNIFKRALTEVQNLLTYFK